MIRILETIELQGWREQPIDMPASLQDFCPCDGTSLRMVAAVSSSESRWASRVGCCPRCGYVGYIDRPTAEWFQQFYASQWDQQSALNLDATIEHLRSKPPEFTPHPISTLAEQVPFNPDARIIDAGCGYGWPLECLRRKGYKHLSGVESCPHRAQVAREAWGFDVRAESIEQHHGGPYDVILSHHVLEHTFDPRAILHKLASLQPEGGYLVLSVPDTATEPTMGVLTFLPHLHSFSRQGLYWLLEDCGYTVILEAKGDINVVARKTSDQSERKFSTIRHSVNCFWAAEHKLRKGLGYPRAGMFAWAKKHDRGWYFDILADRPDANHEPRILRVEPIRERRTDAPIEIQWEGPLRLFVK